MNHNLPFRFAVNLVLIFVAIFALNSCQTKQICSGCSPGGKSKNYSIEERMNVKKLAKDIQKTTSTGTLTKDMDDSGNKKEAKQNLKPKKRQNVIHNKPIL